jgi:hypothetical protein
LFGRTYNHTGFADVFPFSSSFHAHSNSSTANFGFEPVFLFNIQTGQQGKPIYSTIEFEYDECPNLWINQSVKITFRVFQLYRNFHPYGHLARLIRQREIF